jgi:hypothetical protein
VVDGGGAGEAAGPLTQTMLDPLDRRRSSRASLAVHDSTHHVAVACLGVKSLWSDRSNLGMGVLPDAVEAVNGATLAAVADLYS